MLSAADVYRASIACDGSNGMFVRWSVREEREEDGMGVELPRGTSRTADPLLFDLLALAMTRKKILCNYILQ